MNDRRLLTFLPQLILSGLLLASPIVIAAEPTGDFVWNEISPQVIEGQGWTDVESPFDRLPARAHGFVRDEVWNLGRHAAGLYVNFSTDAKEIAVRWKLTSERLAMSHMPATGVSGVDIYQKHDGQWRFLAVARPGDATVNDVVVARGLAGKPTEYRLYLPLYNGVSSIAIGVPPGGSFKIAPREQKKPIVLYGTSITQGGCASRPGMSYAAILGRRLDVPVINLGFSGNGKSEPEVARLLAELDPAIFVLDPLGNMMPHEVADRIPAFIAIIRERHPETPILLNENLVYPTVTLLRSRQDRVEASNFNLRRIAEERRAAGDRHISIIPAADLTVDGGDTTVDGTHPTDYGFLLMANAMEPSLREALGAAKP